MIRVFASNALIYGVTNGIKSLVPFIMLPILTAHLSSETYGLLSIIEVTILLLVPVISLNINSAINVQYFYKNRDKIAQYISNAILLSSVSFICVSLLLLIFKDYIITNISIDYDILILIPFFAFLRVLPQVLLGIYQITHDSVKFSLFSLAQAFVDLLLSYILVVSLQAGMIGRLQAVHIALFISTALSIFLMRKDGLLRGVNLRFSQDILKFGAPLVPHVMSGTIIAMSDRYFIAYFYGHESVGFYAVAYQLASVMMLLSFSINLAWTPILFSLLKERNKMPTITRYITALSMLYVVAGLIIYIFRDLLFFYFVDNNFSSAESFFSLLLVGFIFQSLYLVFSNFLFFEKETKVLAAITISAAILNLALNYFFIGAYGIIGAAYSTLVTWFVYFSAVAFYVYIFYRRYSYRNSKG